MKNYLSIFILFSAFLVVSACKDQAKSETPEVQTETPAAPVPEAQPADAGAPVPVPAPQAAEPAQNAKGVWHYTCPKGCEGGAGAQGNCAKCGTALAHNAAYHQQ